MIACASRGPQNVKARTDRALREWVKQGGRMRNSGRFSAKRQAIPAVKDDAGGPQRHRSVRAVRLRKKKAGAFSRAERRHTDPAKIQRLMDCRRRMKTLKNFMAGRFRPMPTKTSWTVAGKSTLRRAPCSLLVDVARLANARLHPPPPISAALAPTATTSFAPSTRTTG